MLLFIDTKRLLLSAVQNTSSTLVAVFKVEPTNESFAFTFGLRFAHPSNVLVLPELKFQEVSSIQSDRAALYGVSGSV